MSKRGNCWDNAPQESFFGHFKDEVDYRNCRNIVELEDRIWKYAEYYNFDRP
jgi:transposase InsO family protein